MRQQCQNIASSIAVVTASRVYAELEAMGLATEELGKQLRGLPSHALPLRGGKRR